MEVKATPAAAQNRTKQLLKLHGDPLICERYRYDKSRQKRLKTVEIVVDEQDWKPEITFPVHQRVPLKIDFVATELRDQMKQAEAYWNPEKSLDVPLPKSVAHGAGGSND